MRSNVSCDSLAARSPFHLKNVERGGEAKQRAFVVGA